MDGSITFARWRQCALPYGHIATTWRIQLNLCFLRPTRVENPNSISISSAAFHTDDSRVPLYFTMGAYLPQSCSFPWGIWTLSNTWFPGPIRVLNPNGISIGSAIFAGLTSVTDRPTDHATRLVTIDHIYAYIRSTGDSV